jgi:hypothetical protein
MRTGAVVDFHIVHLFPKGGSVEEPDVAADGTNLFRRDTAVTDVTVMEDCASGAVRGERPVFAGRPRIKLGDDWDARPVSGSLGRFPFRVGHAKDLTKNPHGM